MRISNVVPTQLIATDSVLLSWRADGGLRAHEPVSRHLHAGAEVGELEMSVRVEQHVVGLDIAVDEPHAVDRLQGQHNLRSVEPGPFL